MLLALILQAAVPAPPVPAAATPQQADSRCLAAFAAMTSSGTADQQRAAQMGGLFFTGKLVGRNPAADPRALALAEAQALGARLTGELTRCGGELARTGAALSGGAAPVPTPTPSATATPSPRRR